MGKILSVVLGMIAIFLGIWMLFATWPLFWSLVKAGVMLLLVFGGGIATFLGIVELRDSLKVAEDKDVGDNEAGEKK